MNGVVFNTMYKRLGFSALATTELVRTEGINSLRLLGGLNIDCVTSLVKAILRPAGDAIGNDVSETLENHFIVACHIYKYWRCTSQQSKTCADLVTNGYLFEKEERQMELGRTWDNNQAIFHAFTDSEVNKNFNILYKEFEDCCSSVRGCTTDPSRTWQGRILSPRMRLTILKSIMSC